MGLASKRVIKFLLSKYGIAPRKQLGQNFLVSRAVLEEFIEAAHVSKNDTVLEIGPGVGTLTVELAKRAKRLIAVEKDKQLARILTTVLETGRGMTADSRQQTTETMTTDSRQLPVVSCQPSVVNDDIRKFDPKRYTLNAIPYKLVGNLPFYLTNFIIRKFLESDAPPKDMTFIVQKEVAERICAKPPKMNLLAVSVQFYGEPELVSRVPKSAFWPQPEVDAAILRIERKNIKTQEYKNRKFFKVVRAGFAHPRKYLAGNLSRKLKIPRAETERALAESNINLKARAENVSVGQWLTLSKILRV